MVLLILSLIGCILYWPVALKMARPNGAEPAETAETASIPMKPQYYAFPMPNDHLTPIWLMIAWTDGSVMVTPTAYEDTEDAVFKLRRARPSAIVDELFWGDDLTEARHLARTRPLELIG